MDTALYLRGDTKDDERGVGDTAGPVRTIRLPEGYAEHYAEVSPWVFSRLLMGLDACVLAASSSDTAALFWTAAGAIVGFVAVVIAIIALWVAFTGKLRRQLLLYSQSPPVSLLTGAPDSARQDLTVLYGGTPLTNPHVVSIRIRTRCRRDILSTDFDQGAPIVLDLGVPIVAKLAEETGPGRLTLPPIQTKEETIEIGPALLRKRQTIAVTILCNGPNPRMRVTVPLRDVQSRSESYNYPKEEIRAATAVALGMRIYPPGDD